MFVSTYTGKIWTTLEFHQLAIITNPDLQHGLEFDSNQEASLVQDPS